MERLHDLASLLVACWRLASSNNRIPTSHGLLDRALKDAFDKGAFPDWARKTMHFADSRIGLQCVELPSILHWAQIQELTAVPNPSYQFTEIRVSDRVAKQLLKRLDVAEGDALNWGRLISESIVSVQQSGSETRAFIEA
jgi:hypothetical protein